MLLVHTKRAFWDTESEVMCIDRIKPERLLPKDAQRRRKGTQRPFWPSRTQKPANASEVESYSAEMHREGTEIHSVFLYHLALEFSEDFLLRRNTATENYKRLHPGIAAEYCDCD